MLSCDFFLIICATHIEIYNSDSNTLYRRQTYCYLSPVLMQARYFLFPAAHTSLIFLCNILLRSCAVFPIKFILVLHYNAHITSSKMRNVLSFSWCNELTKLLFLKLTLWPWKQTSNSTTSFM
jgi:hypothetical protein